MKKYILFLLALFCISINAIAQVQPTDTDSDGYINISTLDHLRWVSENSGSWSSNFELDNNINAAATIVWNDSAGFSPIGNDATKFSGRFDGKGYFIDSLYINRPEADLNGLIGFSYYAVILNVGITNCQITGKARTGALAGHNEYSTIGYCYSTGNVFGNDESGGLVGELIYSSMSNCFCSTTVTGQDRVGGLSGVNMYWSTVSNCYSTGIVYANVYVGGLIGYNFNNSTIINCYSTDNVYGSNSRVGGLVGYNISDSKVINCYSTGGITGGRYVGGLIGLNQYSSVSNSYSIGNVFGNENVGGLVGLNDEASVNNCFWDTITSGQTTSSGGTGKTTAEMKTKSTFTDVNWDFINVWAIAADYNDGYPNLDGKNDPNGIKEIYSGSLIYPQPAMDEIFVRISEATEESANVKLYDQAGQLALAIEATTNDGLIRLNTSALASGVYRVLINIDGKTYSEKVVVAK